MSTRETSAITQTSPRIVRADIMPSDTPHVPVVIVGAGACGLTASVRLRDAGIECVLLERDSMSRGSTALSSGFIPAAGTRLQKSLGIKDSVDTFAEDIQAKAHGDAAPHLVAAYSTGVPQAIDSLEAHGIGFEVLDGFLYPGTPCPSEPVQR
jgi:fumarate reductase flavoprotein subunit